MPLTEIQVKNAKGRDKPYKLADGGGLHLLVTPAGGRLWRLKYRLGGREKQLSIGAYPTIGLKAAREARDAAKRAMAEGRDPAAEKAAAKRAEAPADAPTVEIVTFSDVAREWLGKAEREGRAKATLDKNTWLTKFAIAEFGNEPIADIKPPTVLACLRKVEGRGRHESARRLRSVIGAIFRYAVATARAETDPTFALQGALTKPVVTPRAAITDPKAFGGLLRALWSFEGTIELGAGLKLLALLAPRPGEMRQARWVEFDLENRVWTIPADRAKMRRPHKVPLGPEAIEILKWLWQFRRSELAFPNIRNDHRPLSENRARAWRWRARRRRSPSRVTIGGVRSTAGCSSTRCAG